MFSYILQNFHKQIQYTWSIRKESLSPCGESGEENADMAALMTVRDTLSSKIRRRRAAINSHASSTLIRSLYVSGSKKKLSDVYFKYSQVYISANPWGIPSNQPTP